MPPSLLRLTLMTLVVMPPLAQASVSFDFRSETNSIYFANPGDLSSATDFYSSVLHATGNGGDISPTYTINTESTLQDWLVLPGTNLNLTGGNAPIGNQTSFSLQLYNTAPSNALDTTSGSNNLVYGYDVGAVQAPQGFADSFMVFNPTNNTLQVSIASAGLLAAGGQYQEFVYIQGDWSNYISGLSIGSGFSTPLVTVTSTASGAETEIFSTNNNYNGVSPVNFNFTLISTVPVPGAVWLFGTAILGYLGLNRRKILAKTA